MLAARSCFGLSLVCSSCRHLGLCKARHAAWFTQITCTSSCFYTAQTSWTTAKGVTTVAIQDFQMFSGFVLLMRCCDCAGSQERLHFVPELLAWEGPFQRSQEDS
jgi:hypothetical protein